MNRRARSILLLSSVTALALAGCLAWQHWTAGPIHEAQRRMQEREWLAVLPQAATTTSHSRPLALTDNQVATQPAAGRLSRQPGQQARRRHAAQRGAGYAGPIELVIAINIQGRLIGLRVLRQQESPGLGDQLVNPARHWLDQFIGKAHDAPPEQAWALKRDRGAFDQLAGATVTSRAVIDAVQDALRYFDQHRTSLLGENSHE
jgi:electron transport complex protein RnfG